MKKTLWSKAAAILAAFVILLTFGACGSKQANYYDKNGNYTADGILDESVSKAASGAPEQSAEKKLTYTGNRKII
ncbi:MAG: hypothetical protein K5836_03925, partial [Clostridiales bacterium]|nr:hypothetical protein [Clostridiales bacterium]